MLIWLSLALLAIAHGSYLVPLVRAVRRSELPAPIDFVGLSAVAYFDVGIALEGCGLMPPSIFFTPFFEAPAVNIIIGIGLIAAAPWLIRFGARGQRASIDMCPAELGPGHRKAIFYALTIILCMVCLLLPLSLVAYSTRLWESRALLGDQLGPWIILLSFPMYVLAFYVRLQDAKTQWGRVVLGILVVSASASTLAVGERTLVLLPSFIVLVFAQTFSFRRWVTAIGIGALATALMLPVFKPAYQDSSLIQMVSDTVGNDLYRAPELAATLRSSSPLGAQSIPYPGAGYLYAACLFVPRGLAPFKGESSAQLFTGQIMQQSPQSLSWGFGISAISEAILNFGILAAPLVLIAYGAAIGWLTRQASRWGSLEIPLCLAALWMFGYHLSALLLNFGAMALVGLLCERVFTARTAEAGNAIDAGKVSSC